MPQKYYDSNNGLYGYKNEDGLIIIPAIYEKAEDFEYGLAAVSNDIKWGIIHENGELIIPMDYDELYISGRGWVHAGKGKEQYLFTLDGTLQLQQHNLLRWYYPEENIIRAIKETGWGYMDLQGNTIIPFIYKSLGPVKYGRISYFENGHWGWLDKKGKLMMKASFDENGFWDDHYWWARVDGEYMLYNFANEIVCRQGWKKILLPQKGVAAVKTTKGWQYLNADLKIILQLPPVYDWVEYFSEGFAAVKRDQTWGFIDHMGNQIIELTFESARSFSEGLAAIKLNGLWGYIDTNGEIIIPIQYFDAGSFKNNKAWVKNGYCEWYINKQGEPVSEPKSLYD